MNARMLGSSFGFAIIAAVLTTPASGAVATMSDQLLIPAPLPPAPSAAASNPASNPATTGDKIEAGLKSSFAFPVADFYVRKHESAARELLDGLTATPGLQVPFSSLSVGSGSTGDPLAVSPALTLDLRYRPIGFWFAQIQLAAYLDPAKRAPWNGDFTYSFGYDDYHPYTLSLVYSNFTNNRFNPLPGNPITRIERGIVSLGWKAPVPEALASALLFNNSLQIDCRVAVNVSPRFDREDGGVGEWKRWANLGCRYPFTSVLFVDFNFFVYGHGQQPWDSDYTYAFGLADNRSGRFSIVYANYSGNRFPGRARTANTGTFRDGGLFISWNRQF